ncbi:glycosyltransferase [Paenibacillus thailandensis]|uniref:Glycosyltransferase n=1 Tax=Paenibacillus thailandensis TaxID=393250 RepID=A0ABW5QXM2_9BACL
MITISLCMIVRNEEEVLGRCLSAVEGIADEIIIVDTGSTDKTKEIASSFGAVVYDFEWIDHFAAARNFSFSKATKDYIMWLDADDIIGEKDRLLLLELKKTLPENINSVTMPYNLAFDAKGQVTYSLRRNRIVKRDQNFQWVGPVHELLVCHGPYFHADAAVTHSKNKVFTDRNLRIYTNRLKAGEEFSPRDQFYYANELRTHGQYIKAIEWYGKFLDGQQGWVEDNILACLRTADCYRYLGDRSNRFAALARTLSYDKPRAELCCAMGEYFVEEQKYEIAVYWYNQALHAEKPSSPMALTNKADSTWIPHIQLCLCYDRLGQYDKAFQHHVKARELNPTHPSVLFNEDYFKKRMEKV